MAYNKTVWENDMIIDADSLNNIENKVEDLDADLSKYVDNIKIDKEVNIPNKNFVVGDDVTDQHIVLGTKQVLNGNLYTSTMGIQSTHGLPSMVLRTKKDGVIDGQLNISKNTIHPETSGVVSVGMPTAKFSNGYFTKSVFMGNDSTINADTSNYYALLNFKNNDNSVNYGCIGKGTASSSDLQVRSLISDLELSAPTQSAVRIGTATNYIYTHFGAKEWRLAPKSEISGAVALGNDLERWKTVYLVNSPNVSSDINLKENIVYLNSNNKELNNDKNLNSDKNLNNDDMYNFIKEDLKLAKYNYKNNDRDVIGFIAQDVSSNEKVSNILLSKSEEGLLSYDTGTYINILAGALQKAINKIEELEAKLK